MGTAKKQQFEEEANRERALDAQAARRMREHINGGGSHDDYIDCPVCSRSVLPDATCVCGWSFQEHVDSQP